MSPCQYEGVFQQSFRVLCLLVYLLFAHEDSLINTSIAYSPYDSYAMLIHQLIMSNKHPNTDALSVYSYNSPSAPA